MAVAGTWQSLFNEGQKSREHRTPEGKASGVSVNLAVFWQTGPKTVGVTTRCYCSSHSSQLSENTFKNSRSHKNLMLFHCSTVCSCWWGSQWIETCVDFSSLLKLSRIMKRPTLHYLSHNLWVHRHCSNPVKISYLMRWTGADTKKK